MQQIKKANLDHLVNMINRATDSPMEPHTKGEDGKFTANIGNYHLSWAYGGVCLECMENEDGGVSSAINSGFTTKRDLYNRMRAFLDGIQAKA